MALGQGTVLYEVKQTMDPLLVPLHQQNASAKK